MLVRGQDNWKCVFMVVKKVNGTGSELIFFQLKWSFALRNISVIPSYVRISSALDSVTNVVVGLEHHWVKVSKSVNESVMIGWSITLPLMSSEAGTPSRPLKMEGPQLKVIFHNLTLLYCWSRNFVASLVFWASEFIGPFFLIPGTKLV